MKISYSESEKALIHKLYQLKLESGSHSPSILTYEQILPELKIQVDACFLSNPYATELFIKYFEKEIVEHHGLRKIFESYPSQNHVIAELLGNVLQVPAKNIFIGNGAIEIIQAIIHTFCNGKLLLTIPTFSSYYEFAVNKSQVVYYPLDKSSNFELDIKDYLNKIEEQRPQTIVLINPNNPNGGYFNFQTLQLILKEATRMGVETIILDESFIHFAYEDKDFNLIDTSNLISAYHNLIILKSMSKDFGVAGIRAGYAIMNQERVKTLLDTGFLWNSNGFAEYFFRLYSRKDFIEDYNKVRIKYIKETILFIENLKKIDKIKVYPSYANFVLIELPESLTSEAITSTLLVKYGVYVRDCADKIGLEGNFIRVASRTNSENNVILESLQEIFGLRK